MFLVSAVIRKSLGCDVETIVPVQERSGVVYFAEGLITNFYGLKRATEQGHIVTPSHFGASPSVCGLVLRRQIDFCGNNPREISWTDATAGLEPSGPVAAGKGVRCRAGGCPGTARKIKTRKGML